VRLPPVGGHGVIRYVSSDMNGARAGLITAILDRGGVLQGGVWLVRVAGPVRVALAGSRGGSTTGSQEYDTESGEKLIRSSFDVHVFSGYD
jgi:hypothetical protein